MDFSFKDKFCKHFVSLRQFYNEVHVSFNIDRCLPSRTDKIKISLFHDEKLDVEKKKKEAWINLQRSANFANAVGKFLVKL